MPNVIGPVCTSNEGTGLLTLTLHAGDPSQLTQPFLVTFWYSLR